MLGSAKVGNVTPGILGKLGRDGNSMPSGGGNAMPGSVGIGMRCSSEKTTRVAYLPVTFVTRTLIERPL